jgi:hypothetical protein
VTSTSTGVVDIAIDAQKTTFTGGPGQDIVMINKDATKSISAGSANNNEIILNGNSKLFTQNNLNLLKMNISKPEGGAD